MHGVKAIGHIAIRVRDIERSLAFYGGHLDFAEMFRLNRDGRLWIVYLRITDDQFLELFPDADTERAPPASANGLNHLCLEVEDIEATLASLAERGVPLARPKSLGADGNYQAWLEDPDGNRIELMQLSSDSLQRQAIARLRGQTADL
jgi:lactoylglutathione lyase